MELKNYFESTKGYGVLSTANKNGEVNAAIYSRPHVMDDGSLAIIMNNRLSHKNVTSNPKAHFLFIEDGPGYKGVRLLLTMLREEQDTELLYSLCRRCYPKELEQKDKTRFLVFFRVDRQSPLVGAGA
ncbi:pyridoxamine 5'-phosphate oxidase family protein [Paucidesulfovibrio longus]|uniref:pyridoxamine 5'-phosphate oxidase family protein n=1 Tax=Paucidesulfovibrio longus TaxID=889 RepID=UPI0003B44A32|nr:pyridoxamine 5'-phosphate oxidase family protein [Paucidesulfovibrio longus]